MVKQSDLVLPTDTPLEILPNRLNDFFINKISKIRSVLDSANNLLPVNTF